MMRTDIGLADNDEPCLIKCGEPFCPGSQFQVLGKSKVWGRVLQSHIWGAVSILPCCARGKKGVWSQCLPANQRSWPCELC